MESTPTDSIEIQLPTIKIANPRTGRPIMGQALDGTLRPLVRPIFTINDDPDEDDRAIRQHEMWKHLVKHPEIYPVVAAVDWNYEEMVEAKLKADALADEKARSDIMFALEGKSVSELLALAS